MVNVDLMISTGLWLSGLGMTGLGLEMTADRKASDRKWSYRIAFGLLGMTFIALSYMQSERADRYSRELVSKHQEEQIRNEGNIKFVEGQLETMTAVLHGLAGTSDPKQIVAALMAVIPKTPVPITKSEPNSPLRDRLNQLSTMVYQFAAERTTIEHNAIRNRKSPPTEQSMQEEWKESVITSGETEAQFYKRLLPQINTAIQEAAVSPKVQLPGDLLKPETRNKYPGLKDANWLCGSVSYSRMAQECAAALQELATEVK